MIERDAQSSIIEFESRCGTCKSCAQRSDETRTLKIPIGYKGSHEASFPDQIDLELKLSDQCFVLFNSWLLPLFLALAFAFIADSIRLSEIYGIIFAVCGFSVGVLLCRGLKASAVTAKEVYRGKVNG